MGDGKPQHSWQPPVSMVEGPSLGVLRDNPRRRAYSHGQARLVVRTTAILDKWIVKWYSYIGRETKMPLTREQVENLHRARLPVFGWMATDEGWLTAPDDFAHDTAFTADEYALFAERTRARWDLVTYLRTLLNQWSRPGK